MKATTKFNETVRQIERLWVEVSYCSPAMFGTSYSSGSKRMYQDAIGFWLQGELLNGKPILITAITTLEPFKPK